jgi:hypothetical protein
MEHWDYDDEKRPVRGPVRTLSSHRESKVYHEGEWVDNGSSQSKYGWRFDSDGHILEGPALGYVDQGDPVRFEYVYDASGRREGCEGFDYDDSHIQRVDIAYPPEGGRVRSVYYTGRWTAEPCLTSRCWFDASGRPVEARSYASDGTVHSRTLSLFESEGATIVERRYRFGANRDYMWDIEQPRITVEDPVFGEGVLQHVATHSFDAGGRQVEERLSLPDGTPWCRTVFAFGPEETAARYQYHYGHRTGVLRQIEMEYRDRLGEPVEKLVIDGEVEVVLLGEGGHEAQLEVHRASLEGVRGLRISLREEGWLHAHEYRRGEHELLERVSLRATLPSGAVTDETTRDRGGPLNYHQRTRYVAYDAFENWTSAVTDFRNCGYWSRDTRTQVLTYFSEP